MFGLMQYVHLYFLNMMNNNNSVSYIILNTAGAFLVSQNQILNVNFLQIYRIWWAINGADFYSLIF